MHILQGQDDDADAWELDFIDLCKETQENKTFQDFYFYATRRYVHVISVYSSGNMHLYHNKNKPLLRNGNVISVFCMMICAFATILLL